MGIFQNNNTGKMSAIVEEPDGFYEPIKVLITLHEGMDTMDAIGPMEVFRQGLHDKKVKESKAFRVIFAGKEQNTMTAQNIPIRAHIDYDEAMKRIGEIDLLIVPGGGTDNQPMPLIKAFSELQKKNPSRERSLVSVCTGSLFLAEAGILSGLAATTHPDYVTKME